MRFSHAVPVTFIPSSLSRRRSLRLYSEEAVEKTGKVGRISFLHLFHEVDQLTLKDQSSFCAP